LNAAIKKYGKENFKKEIIDTADDIIELNEKEKYWIEKLNSIVPNGYNIASGGDGGYTMEHASEDKIREWKQKIGEKSKGRVLSDVSRKKISDKRKGMMFSQDTCEKISEARKRQIMTPESIEKTRQANIGHTVSVETRKKISDATMGKNKGKTPPNKGIPMSDAQRKQLSDLLKGTRTGPDNQAFGKKWMNDGKTNAYVTIEEIDEYMNRGYVFGMIKKNKKLLTLIN
jgi:hypothetical protein